MIGLVQESNNLLLLIDNNSLESSLLEYFAEFGYKIKQIDNLNHLSELGQLPIALLINWSIFQADLTVIQDLYQRYPIPIIVISDSANEQLTVQMLEAGADDFLVKPFNPRELHARINAIVRRVNRYKLDQESEKEVLIFDNWRLYPASRQIFSKTTREELQLSVGEYDLLLTFLRQPHQILDRELLLQITKNSGLNPFDRRIDVQISRLRQKIEVDAKKPKLIKTVRNGGYVFTTNVLVMKEYDSINL